MNLLDEIPDNSVIEVVEADLLMGSRVPRVPSPSTSTTSQSKVKPRVRVLYYFHVCLGLKENCNISDHLITRHHLKFFQTGFLWKIFRPLTSHHLKTFQTGYFIFRFEKFSDHLPVTIWKYFKPDSFVKTFQTTDQSPFESFSYDSSDRDDQIWFTSLPRHQY